VHRRRLRHLDSLTLDLGRSAYSSSAFGPLPSIGGYLFLLSLQVVETEQPLLRVSFFFVVFSPPLFCYGDCGCQSISVSTVRVCWPSSRGAWSRWSCPHSEYFRCQISLHDGKHDPFEMPESQPRRLILLLMISGNMVDWGGWLRNLASCLRDNRRDNSS
jgi:hypothetical protein